MTDGVTQADRDAAEELWLQLGPFRMGTVGATAEAFARHRQQAIAQNEDGQHWSAEYNADGELLICTGCHSSSNLEDVRTKRPGTISCCPERKMVTVAEFLALREGGRGEPVAWMYKTHLGQSFVSTFRRTHYDGFPLADETPLYAHPPAAHPDALAEGGVEALTHAAQRDAEELRLTRLKVARQKDELVLRDQRITQQAEEVARLREALTPIHEAYGWDDAGLHSEEVEPIRRLIAAEINAVHSALSTISDGQKRAEEVSRLREALSATAEAAATHLKDRMKADADNKYLREALKPFGLAASDLEPSHPDSVDIWDCPAALSINASHLRVAAALVGEPVNIELSCKNCAEVVGEDPNCPVHYPAPTLNEQPGGEG